MDSPYEIYKATKRMPKYTIRHNTYDRDYTDSPCFYIDSEDTPHSLNKHKNWELLDDPSIKQIKYHRNVYGDHEDTNFTNKNPGCGTGGYSTFKKGKDFVSVDGKRCNQSFKHEDGNYIVMAFDKNEYPINRQGHQGYETPCKGCLQSHGRIWQLKGHGDKSVGKNKGMKREKEKDLKFYHDF